MDKGIWSIVHLLDVNGEIPPLDDLNNKQSTNSSIDYRKVTNNIPRALIHSVKVVFYCN